MKLCDEAGAMAAIRHATRSCVTVVVDSMTFDAPVYSGDLVTFEAEVTWVGRTSIETRVLVKAENILTGRVTHTNTAYFVYVALDEIGRPCPVSPLLLQTPQEEEQFKQGEARQARRLKLRKMRQEEGAPTDQAGK